MEKCINDMTSWLAKVEESLMNCAQTKTWEGLRKVKVGNHLSSSLHTSNGNIVSPVLW